MNANNLTLWEKIERFPIDDDTAVLPFSAKLAKEQNWTVHFTQRAILEYKRFIFLCCVLDNGASPSTIVDEVWHLHLTYTRSYWNDFCKNTLGKDLHHIPSKGGNDEDHKHLEWYKETLAQYKVYFDSEAPADIWPPPSIPTPKLPPVKQSFYHTAAAIFCTPFFIIFVSYHRLNPFLLSGPHFLFFFPIFAGAILGIAVMYQYYRKYDYEQIAIRHLPSNANAYQLAAFLFGKNRAVQTAIINLLNRNLLAINASGNFRIKRRQTEYYPLPNEENPIMDGWEKEVDYMDVPYRRIVDQWYNPDKTRHPALQVLERFVFTGKKVYLLFYLFVLLVGLARCIQGIYNDKPVSLLFTQVVVISAIYWFIYKFIPNRKKAIFDKAVSQYDCTDIPMLYALKGPTTIEHFTDAELITAAFGTTITEIYRQGDREIFSNDNNSGNSCGSSGTGGGCSSGGGCSGGGGGCGGCGGGGD